jgi:GNAT superfamily N-acetyltransferase
MTDPDIHIEILTGRDAALRAAVPDLARLRIEVFREYPYLYTGSPAYEEKYLETYTRCADSVAVLARSESRVVGASTGLPLAAETPECQAPFIASGYAVAEIFYCGESVLLPAFRGKGLYKTFFNGREQHARALGGFRYMALCGVVRPDNHPRRPAGYAPLDPVWQRFGYVCHPELTTTFDWQDLDEAHESPKRMQFWLKALT